jgi:hypothetical protein
MKLHARRAIPLILLMLAGCAETDFTEDDSGRIVELSQGSGFFVRLPRLASGPRQAPDIKGALIRPLEKKIDTVTNQEVFQFVAEGVGDAVIRIAPAEPSTPEFVIQIHVLPGSKPSTGAGGPSKPPGSY